MRTAHAIISTRLGRMLVAGPQYTTSFSRKGRSSARRNLGFGDKEGGFPQIAGCKTENNEKMSTCYSVVPERSEGFAPGRFDDGCRRDRGLLVPECYLHSNS